MLQNKIFGVVSLGCDKNRVDSEKLLGLLKEKGYALTDDPAQAHVIIVNTCAFLASAREEAIETALELAEYKRGKLEKLVITGCLPQKFIGELFKPLQEADLFLGINEYEKLLPALEECYRSGKRIELVGEINDQSVLQKEYEAAKFFAFPSPGPLASRLLFLSKWR